jgi:SAM-dependent methyltransferase
MLPSERNAPARPDPLVEPLADNARLVALIADVTGAAPATVRKRLGRSERAIGTSVARALAEAGLPPYVWGDGLARFYEESDAFVYDLVAWNRNANKLFIRSWMADFFGALPAPADVLVYGDGLGFDSAYLARAGQRVHYYEVGAQAQRFARAVFDMNKVIVQVRSNPADLLPESYDAVVCLDVLEHVPDPPALVGRLARCLRPGGYLIASAPFFMVVPEYPTHLECNRRFSGSLNLYRRHGLDLVGGRTFLDPVILGKSPVQPPPGWGGLRNRVRVRFGAAVLRLARLWSWPHRQIGRLLQRRGYRYHLEGLEE